MTRIAHLVLLALFFSSTLLPLTGCETDTSPAPMGNNPPPPPTRTPTDLRHRPNTGVHMMSDELTPEEAAKLGRGDEHSGDEDSGDEDAGGGEAGKEEEKKKEEPSPE